MLDNGTYALASSSAEVTDGGRVVQPDALDLPVPGRAKNLAPLSLSPDKDQPAFVARFSAGVMSSLRYDSTAARRCIRRNPGGRSGTASGAETIAGAIVS